MSALQTWQQFLSRCLSSRLQPEQFASFLPIILQRTPLPAQAMSDLFLSPTEDNDVSLDPRVVRYVLLMVEMRAVGIQDVLKSLRRVSSFARFLGESDGGDHGMKDGVVIGEKTKEKGGKREVKRWISSYTAEETLFYRLTKTISSGAAPPNIKDAVKLVAILISWMSLINAASHSNSILNLSHTQTSEMNAQTMALSTLVVSVVENPRVVEAISKGRVSKATRQELATVLASFVPLLMQTSPQNAARLEVFRTQTFISIEPVDKSDKKAKEADKAIEDILTESMGVGVDGIEGMVLSEVEGVNSRAGLYVYVNSLLVGRPLIDDNAIYAYLHNRYQGDIRQTIIDLILAAFDVLANATFRNERAQTITILRSFLINKVPLLLVNLSSSLFPPLTSEYCITEALSHVDTTAFPTLSNMFDESNNLFSDSVRQDFCFACCLHDLLPESSIEGLLGDVPMQSLPAGGRYHKEDLVQQYVSDPERTEGLVDELEHMDGNVGAVSLAIVDVITRLCNNKETMSLKSLCSQLAKKPSSLDVLLLFSSTTAILQPICQLLDNSHYDEDQSEYQPVYEEFGSILLLVLSFVHRYNLSLLDLGLATTDSFIAKLLNQGHLSRALDELSQTEQNHLDGWIKGLFDNESGGLGDELMSSCPPQDFYLLVPTLFHHIVLACSTKNLSDESLRNGLEYLIEPFLLPSLIPGITWLSSHLWESRGDANAVLQILSSLITTRQSSNSEASSMLSSILNIVAKNLEHSLRWLQRAEPSRQDVEPLSKALRQNLTWERRAASDHTELESWTSTLGGGLITSLKATIHTLVQWAQNPAMNINPASYTHRQLLVAIKLLGAKRVLLEIVEEIRTHTEAGNAAIIYDIATALISTPDAASFSETTSLSLLSTGAIRPLQRRLHLREALKMEAEGYNDKKTREKDLLQTEIVVRLYRKVEAALVLPVQMQMTMQHDDPLGAALDAEVAAGALVGADVLGVGDASGLGDLSADGMGGMGMGMGMGMEDGDFVGDLLGGGMGDDGFGDGFGDGMGF